MENQSNLVTYLMLAISFIIASSAVININAHVNETTFSPLVDVALALFMIGLCILLGLFFKILGFKIPSITKQSK